MYELIKLTDLCYYVESPAKIGIIKTGESEVCLIDSGSDKDAGKKVLKHLDANGWTLKAIYNTHSNADHIGGNKFLQEKTGCKIYAPEIECDFTRHPILEPSFLYGGNPPKELRGKFLMAPESDAEYLTPESLPKGFEMIELTGHFFNMAGFRSPDGVVYLADCLSSKETLEKYQIGFIYDVLAYLETLEKLKSMEGRIFVPAHAPVTEDITELAQYNIDKVNEIAELITELCAQPLCFEALLKKLFDHYSLVMNFQQYALVGSTVKSYLTYLKDMGKIEACFEDNMLVWKRV